MNLPGTEVKPFRFFDWLSVFLATGFYLSLLPKALVQRVAPSDWNCSKWSGCGLVGSVMGVATYLLLPIPWASSIWLLVGGTFFSVVVTARAEKVLGQHDDTRIVMDEWIGAWIAATGATHALGLPIVLAFVLFRLFDVVKGPFGKLQRLPGGWGVTMDDVAAGLAAMVIVRLIY